MLRQIDLLIGEPCPELLCGICQDVLDEPIQVHCPEDHLFCSKCIQKHIETENTCPLCFTAIDKTSFQLSKFAQRQISRLRIQCPNHINGCPWQGLRGDSHIEHCEYVLCPCPNTENGCTEKNLLKINMKRHIDECPYQQMTCPNNMPLCQPFLRKDLGKHESECQSYTCPYAHEGCPFIGTLNQAKAHCEGYCGRLHKTVDDLTEEVKRLNKIIQDISFGLSVNMPSTPENCGNQKDNGPTVTKKEDQDTSMNEMALFHEMFNSDLFEPLDLNNDESQGTSNNTNNSLQMSSSQTTSATTMQQTEQEQASTEMMDISSLDFLNSLSVDNLNLNSNIFDAPSPQPLEFIPPTTVPKRTSNGKKIRYSKNVRLAHSALRMARERTANVNNPTNDAILNNLNIAKQKNNQLTFKHVTDVNKFINNDEAKSTKKEKKKPTNIKSAESPKPDSPLSPSQNSSKRRPMFILASSYLSNYNTSNNNNSTTNNNQET
ncbi:hypothetical protein RMATCC62417_01927 [Rhizopus microsporus]|nr:hypothetical protein RMATCC62417_01927 [Rhizopus microsporus]